MTVDTSLWTLVANASWVVKCVMLLLITASLVSWTMIFQRFATLKNAHKALDLFEERFWSGSDLSHLFAAVAKRRKTAAGLELIFFSGYSEYARLRKLTNVEPEAVMEGAQRAMRIVLSREMDELETHLPFLATVGSTSPYIGLLGTVWGIMDSLRALGQVQQATLAMVAPGIAEALIATAFGLIAAIPAVIAYNKFASEVERISNHYETFQEEFTSILHRQAHTKAAAA